MILCDVNILLNAHKQGAVDHDLYNRWLIDALNGDEPFGCSDLVLSAVVRIATNPKILDRPSTLEEVWAFADAVRGHPNTVSVAPGPRHWDLFAHLCRRAEAKGNLVPDAYLAALAVEHGCEWITADRDFARFPGLRWRHPFG